MAVRLFVGNLPYEVTEAEVRELFSAVAPPSYVRLPTDRETGKPRGFAFVEFADRAKAEEAIRRFNLQVFKGRPLAVNEARPREAGPPPRTGPPGGRPSWSSAPASRPSWSPGGGATEPPPSDRQPRRNFGPDALPRHKRRHDTRGSKGERTPKTPLRERNRGRFSPADVEDALEEVSAESFPWVWDTAEEQGDEPDTTEQQPRSTGEPPKKPHESGDR